MPILYLALAAGALYLWSVGSGGSLFGSAGCQLDDRIPKAVEDQVRAFLDEEHDAEEHQIAAGMLDAGGYPKAANCVRAHQPTGDRFLTSTRARFRIS